MVGIFPSKVERKFLQYGRNHTPVLLQNWLKPYYRKLFHNVCHVAITPTFRCNYRCPYCHFVTKAEYYNQYPKSSEHTAEEWVHAMDKFPNSLISICGGGEPFLYDDIFDLIRGLSKKHTITNIVSNISVKIDEIIENVDEDIRISASFHSYMTDLDKFSENIVLLKENGFKHINVTFVGYPEKIHLIPELFSRFSKIGVGFTVDPYLDPSYSYSKEEINKINDFVQNNIRKDGYDNGDTRSKVCLGGTKWFGMFPKGDVYTCFAGFYYANKYYNSKNQDVSKYYLGNLFTDSICRNESFICSLPCCEACDLELAAPKIK